MEKNNNDRKKIAITLSLKFKEMAASFDAIGKSLADLKDVLQQLADSANRQELKDKIECGQLSLDIGPISLADMETSENQLSGPKMCMPPTIHLPGYNTEQPQTLAELEAYLVKVFGFDWDEYETNYMTVDAPNTKNVCYIKQWLDKPVIRVGSWANRNHNADGFFTGCIDGRLLENIDWKDCLFTRTTNETNE